MNSPTGLVSAEWLHEHLNDESIRIVDCTRFITPRPKSEQETYCERHIPGAVFFDLAGCRDKTSPYPNMLPPPDQFGAYVSQLGISNATHVIVYDDNPEPGMFSVWRLWWMFRVFGHETVSVLDGGIAQWLARGYATSNETPVNAPAEFKATLNSSLVKSFEDVKDNISTAAFQLVDVRANADGRIGSSVVIPFTTLLNDQKCMKSADEIHQLILEKGLRIDQPMASHSNAATSACSFAFAAFLCGKRDVAVFDGSWSEWVKRSQSE